MTSLLRAIFPVQYVKPIGTFCSLLATSAEPKFHSVPIQRVRYILRTARSILNFSKNFGIGF